MFIILKITVQTNFKNINDLTREYLTRINGIILHVTTDESSKEYDFLLASGCTIGGAFVILAIAFVAVRLFYHKRRSNEGT